LAKNRDLPYNPHIDIIHEIVNGTEVVYMMDKKNGWIEGINEYGTGMVNSSLLEDFHHYPGYNILENKMYSALVKKHMNKDDLFDELLKKSDNKYILEGHTLSLRPPQGKVVPPTIRMPSYGVWHSIALPHFLCGPLNLLAILA
jgi:hypothetical protein